MSWSIGFDTQWNRDIGYGVPAYCDHPKCSEEIDRGLSYVCAGQQIKGGDGCGLYFCDRHRSGYKERLGGSCCARCQRNRPPFTPKPEHPIWLRHKLTDKSWAEWRADNPNDVAAIRAALGEAA